MTDSDPRNLGDKGEIISASIAPFHHKLGWTKPLHGTNLYLHWFDVLKILGDWAWMRNRLKITGTPPNGQVMRRSSYTLTILQKKTDGGWVIARDANLVTAEIET